MMVAAVNPAIICLVCIVVLLLSRGHSACFHLEYDGAADFLPSMEYLFLGGAADQPKAICKIPSGRSQIDGLLCQCIEGSVGCRFIGSGHELREQFEIGRAH